jgi:hypothetical protein
MALMRSPGSSTVRSSVYAGSTCERPDTLHSLTHPHTHSLTHTQWENLGSWLRVDGERFNGRNAPLRLVNRQVFYPREALRGGISLSLLEPSCNSWSHFVGIYCQKLTSSLVNRLLRYPHERPCVGTLGGRAKDATPPVFSHHPFQDHFPRFQCTPAELTPPVMGECL